MNAALTVEYDHIKTTNEATLLTVDIGDVYTTKPWSPATSVCSPDVYCKV